VSAEKTLQIISSYHHSSIYIPNIKLLKWGMCFFSNLSDKANHPHILDPFDGRTHILQS